MNWQNKDNGSQRQPNQGLTRLGWDQHFQQQWDQTADRETSPARVVGVNKNSFRLSEGGREWQATAAGKLKHSSVGLFPVAGDWVLARESVITRVLARKNALARGASGVRGKHDEAPRREQMIAANLDTVFIVCGLDRDYRPRRIERYLTLVYNCGLDPVIVLTKADLQEHPEHFAAEVEGLAMGTPVHLVSAQNNQGLAGVAAHLPPGRTAAMVGSSGAGKSTLLNRLYGRELAATAAISQSVGKGRHTTTSRDLFTMPSGGMIIDNPGIREIAFWDNEDGLGAAFPDIESLARQCRFADCGHGREPGCRVLRAVDEGEITPGRLESYRKMKRELDYLASRQHKSADRVEKERWKEVALKIKAIKKRR